MNASTLWEASCPDGFFTGTALAALDKDSYLADWSELNTPVVGDAWFHPDFDEDETGK